MGDATGRKEWVLRITVMAGRVLLCPFFALETTGKENLPKRSAFVLLPKHQRWEDLPLLSLAAPRSLYYVAKHELFGNPLSAWYMRSLGGIPLNRRRPLTSRREMKAVIRRLRAGEGVVLFPEGTYYRDRMGPGHAGMVRLILSRLSLPFIPVGIRYGGRGARKRVGIAFGKAVYGENFPTPAAFMERIMGEIARLSGLS
jgi:1-acyl-sn-glycerol-3-phosphate acyltransferase